MTVKLTNFDSRKILGKGLKPLIEVELICANGMRIHPYQLRSSSKQILHKELLQQATNQDLKKQKHNPYKYFIAPVDSSEDDEFILDGLNIVTIPKTAI